MNHTLTFNTKDKDNFEWIKSGAKIYESRAGSDNYQNIKTNDTITFECGDEISFNKIVGNKYHFKSLEELFENNNGITIKDIMPDNPNKEQATERWLSYPGYEQRIKDYGIIVWELKNI